MSLVPQLSQELTNLVGFNSSSPRTVVLPANNGVEMAIDFTVVDTLSCAFRELRLDVPRLAGASFALLKQWADEISRRITYLLENIGPLEFDPTTQQVLIPPGSSACDAITLIRRGLAEIKSIWQ